VIDPTAYTPVAGLDINAEDVVFKNPVTNRLIKVRMKRVPPPPKPAPQFGLAVLEMSGSHCDENGKAIPLTDGRPGWEIGAPQRHSLDSNQAFDMPVQLDRLRRLVAASTERAVALEEALRAVPNI